MAKMINQDLLQNQAAAASYQSNTKSLWICNLRNIKLLPRLAKAFPDTEELILDTSDTPNYFRQLNAFEKLNKLSLENVAYIPDTNSIIAQITPPYPPIHRLRLVNTPLLGASFANLALIFCIEELELSGIDVVAEEFWPLIDHISLNITALSIREIELSPDFFAHHLSRMKKLKRLSLSAFCSNPISLRQMDVSHLIALEELEISNVGIQALPSGFSRLERLKKLNVSNSPMPALADRGPDESHPNGSVQYLTEETTQILRNLEFLDISGTALRKLPGNVGAMHLREFRAGSTELQSLPDCFLCESLEVLEMPNSGLEVLRESSFGKLSALKRIDLSYTQMKKLPTQAACQESLRVLCLQGISGLHWLPDWVADCTSLKELDLRQLQLDEFPEKLLYHPLDFCDFENQNPSPVVYPKDQNSRTDNNGSRITDSAAAGRSCRVFTKGIRLNTLDPKLLLTNDTPLLRSYVDAVKRPIHRGNLIFLGDSGVGKHTLIERITGTNVSEWENCLGMNILEDSFAFEYLSHLAGCRSSSRIQVRIMEMSGSPSAQFIHPLFLTNHSLYIIVLDGQKEFLIQERAVWWARLVEAYAPNAHIIFAIWQDSGSTNSLNIPLLRQEVWMDQEPEAVYLTGTHLEEESTLCSKIMKGLQSLLLAQLCLPESWIRLLSHFEQLLETRMMLHRSFIDQLMERYIHPGKVGRNNECLKKYLLTFEGETVGRMAHTSVQSAENMFFHTDWLGEGLYRVAEFARKHGGTIKNPKELWATLLDSAQRSYSFAHVKMLLDFCERQLLCYRASNEYVFPGFTAELEKLEYGKNQGEYSNLIRSIQTDEAAERYIVHCPVLSQMMLSQLITGIINIAGSDSSDIITGQNGLFLQTSRAGALLLLGQVGPSAKLHLYFSRVLSSDPKDIIETNRLDFMKATFTTLRSVLNTLPEHLRRQYRISIQRSTGNLAEPRFAQLAEISVEELAGYSVAGRSSYFCGVLNQTFEIRQLGYLPSPL